ncbi:PREDICTED: probable lysosomal cobalamin transporter [Acropora digitifera]|uniref:probable lysosomal cobalamin transporter n=1 Tax=Acropora digitifera TaxID=70779 RepID=UPI000779F823|nr:PREDICTED: probable lysosomal cobalamin transporter [Acropora digitifera]
MTIPHEVLAYGWIPFTVVVVLIFFFSWFYIRFYQDHSQTEVSSTLTAIFALTVTLLTTALVPVDIFIVSYMKHDNGTWKDWCVDASVRKGFEETSVTTVYYVLYSFVALFAFLLMPFVYFYFEEKDEDVTTRQRICGALKYSIGFLIVAVALLLIGAFVPLKKPPQNETHWKKELSFLANQLKSNHGETALSLVMGFLSFIGMVIMITYTAYGMTALPFSMLKGFKNTKMEHLEVSQERESVEERARMIRARHSAGRTMSRRDERLLSRLEGEERVLIRRERHLQAANLSWLNKCLKCCRPFEFVFGILFLLFGLLIFVSLLLTSVDKALNSLGYKYGYALPKAKLPNPINIVLVYAQKVFPLDYCLFVGIVLFFLYCTMSGIRAIGIRCFCIKVSYILSFQPSNAHTTDSTPTNHTSTNGTTVPTASPEPRACDTDAGEDACIMTRAAVFLNRFFYKVWFFGACYYWGTWVFLVMYVIGLGVSIAKKRKSVVDDELDSSDYDSSDDEMISA